MTRQELDAAIAQQLDSDPEFRTRLTEDPNTTVSELLGLPVPEAVTITVHLETPTQVHLVLPAQAEQVSEEDLSLVSGGWSPQLCSDPTPPCAACG